MKKTVSAILIALAVQIVCLGQTNREMLEQDPYRVLGSMYPYHRLDSVYTPAPKGYRLFYISHIGRHGSRYCIVPDKKKEVLAGYASYLEQGMLTDEGVSIYRDLKTIIDGSEGKFGTLSSVGEKELRGIGKRMAENSGNLFKGKAVIETYSTDAGRTRGSRDCMLDGIREGNDGLVVIYNEPERKDPARAQVCGYHMPDSLKKGTSHNSRSAREYYMDRWNEGFNPEPFKTRIYAGTPEIESFRNEAFRLYETGNSFMAADENFPDIMKYFTKEELYNFWLHGNTNIFSNTCEWDGSQPYKTYNWGAGIVESMIKDAEEVIAGRKDIVATLRFTHDSYIMPAESFMNIKGVNFRTFAQAEENFRNYEKLCLGVNVQLFFYRNAKGQVLVKILQNEKETTVEDLKPNYSGVYYKWDKLKAYWKKRADSKYRLK